MCTEQLELDLVMQLESRFRRRIVYVAARGINYIRKTRYNRNTLYFTGIHVAASHGALLMNAARAGQWAKL